MTPAITGIIVGLTYGAIVGFAKYAFLWKNITKSHKKITMGAMYLRMVIGYAINFAMLLFIFLMRNHMPFDFMATIISSAIALSLMGKLNPIKEVVNQVEIKQEKQEEQDNL